jgi:ankyrin repeat protein
MNVVEKKPGLKFAVEIHDAVLNGDPLLVQACLEHGQDINTLGRGHQTPLIHAILNGKIEVVEHLLRWGADTTIGEENGYTPMHAAAFAGQAKILRMLIAHGLSPNDILEDG